MDNDHKKNRHHYVCGTSQCMWYITIYVVHHYVCDTEETSLQDYLENPEEIKVWTLS